MHAIYPTVLCVRSGSARVVYLPDRRLHCAACNFNPIQLHCTATSNWKTHTERSHCSCNLQYSSAYYSHIQYCITFNTELSGLLAALYLYFQLIRLPVSFVSILETKCEGSHTPNLVHLLVRCVISEIEVLYKYYSNSTVYALLTVMIGSINHTSTKAPGAIMTQK